MSDTTPTRKPLTGSCHCGFIRYILFLTLPNPFSETNPPSASDQLILRCNCTTCHKLGALHIKPADVTRDFLLLSPLDPFTELGDYTTNDAEIHFFFCKVCGVRCFSLTGGCETAEVDLAALGALPNTATTTPGGVETETETKTKVWRATEQGGNPEYGGTKVMVNALTVDAGQESLGFDLRVFTEKRQVKYADTLPDKVEDSLPARWDRPHLGGCY